MLFRSLSQVICDTCHHPGHYANECPEKKNKAIELEEEQGTFKKYISQVECHECHKMGHYSWDCPEKKKNKGIATRGYVADKEHRKDLSHVTCFKCKEEGHYISECPERKLQNIKGKVVITKNRGTKSKVAAKKETTPRNDLEGARVMSKVFCHHCRKT